VLLASGLAVEIHALGLDRLPDVHAVMARSLPSDSLIYDRTGAVLIADLHPGGYQHYETRLGEMGRWLPAATDAESGSVIAQRLVRLRMGVGGPSTAARIRQAVLAARLSLTYSHSQVLEAYLQSLFFGSGAYGPQAAAQIYFGVDASKLDLAQAALLAGLTDQPTQLDPFRNLSGAKQRQHQVLDAMVRNRTITAAQAAQAWAETLQLTGPKPSVQTAPEFVQYVVDALTARVGKDAPLRGGLRVVTTLDLGLQRQAELALKDAVTASSRRRVTSGALVAVDPRGGELMAMVGSVDRGAPGGSFNMAVVPRNPGTAFRAFTYTAAIASKRYTMVTPLPDVPIAIELPAGSVPQTYKPMNFDGRFHGTCELQACLGNSLTPPALQAELGTGIPEVVKMARALGAPPFLVHFDPAGAATYRTDDPPESFGPALTLGGYGETALQMTTAISALAGGGVLHHPTAIREITGPTRVVLKTGAAPGVQAVDAGAAFIVSQMLADDVNRAMIFGRGSPLALPGRHAAALTGGTDDFRDAWAAGYTPSLATAVWMGNPRSEPLVSGSDAIFVAAPAWHQFMQSALDQMGKGDEWYAPPAGVESAELNGRQAYFLAGTSAGTPAPPLPDQVHLGVAGAGQ